MAAKDRCETEKDEMMKKMTDSSTTVLREKLLLDEERRRFLQEKAQLQVEKESGLSTNSLAGFSQTSIITKTTKKYDVTPNPDCWQHDCNVIPANIKAYAKCTNDAATHWNKMGVQFMERYFEGDTNELKNYNVRGIEDAEWCFSNATVIDPTCGRPFANLALVYMMQDKIASAVEKITKAIELEPFNPRYYAMRSFMNELASNEDGRIADMRKAESLDKYIAERRYFSVLLANTTYPEKYRYFPIILQYSRLHEQRFIKKMLLYLEFGRVAIGQYTQLPPQTKEDFIESNWAVMRNVMPPYVQKAYMACYREEIDDGILKLEDAYAGQALRYYAFNDRCGRFIHFQLVDLVRRVIAHNAQPTYLYFGGYVNSSRLVPHTDRPPCEFTISLNLGQNPADKPWPLGLGVKPLIERDPKYEGMNNLEWPPKEEQRWAHLYPGDALLFMGRHLNHFREDALHGEDRWVNQVFLHYANDKYNGVFE
eukprot:TRINITY_DN1310_c0_g1_i3.p1 TRINITY_DN1310_c0_g1~~TRINITY_DN1310_c0_g1_i3.p1  ORF type:complete len:555 (-),score=108.29 TRINITY_DN1310_c0_g1_i3:152-1597(-)